MTCNPPTIIFPNGGETVLERTLDIEWFVPDPHHPSGVSTWYELFFTDDFEVDKKNEWKQIASTPANVNIFSWRIPFSVRSSKCRLGIRCRDARGLRSDISHIADNFEIVSQDILPPAVITPESNATYRLSVPILFDHGALRGTTSQRAFYRVYYSSDALGVDWTPANENIAFDSGVFVWDVRDIAPSNDYRLKFELVDESGFMSEPVFVDNVTIYPMNFVLLDTISPIGSITAESTNQFTTSRDIVVKLKAFDETTGVDSVQIGQTELDGNSTSGVEGIEQPFAKIQTWFIQGDDGVKFIEAKFRDFAGNILVSTAAGRFFRKFLSDDNNEVSAFTINGDDIWTAFDDAADFPLYNGVNLEENLSGAATSMIFFDNILHLGIRDSDDKGLLQKYQDGEITNLHQFSDLDSVVNGMAVFDDELYMGLRNGSLYKFDGSTVTLVKTFSNQVKGLFADGVSLYVFEENSGNIVIYDGTSFMNASFLDGSQ